MKITKTKTGKWSIRWGRSATDKKYHQRTFATRREALAYREKLELRKNGSMTVGDAAMFWLNGLEGGSRINAESAYRNHIAPTFADTDLADLKPVMVHDWMSEKRKTLAPKTVNNLRADLLAILNRQVELELIDRNPVAKVKKLRVPQKFAKFWSFDDADRFLSWSKANNGRLFEIVRFCLQTGVRKSELAAVRKSDFDRNIGKTGSVNIVRKFSFATRKIENFTKGKADRRVPVRADLADWIEAQPSGELFGTACDMFLKRHFAKCQRFAGVPVLKIHELRHTAISHWAMLGVNPFTIMKWAGHKNIETSLNYTHLSDDYDLRELPQKARPTLRRVK